MNSLILLLPLIVGKCDGLLLGVTEVNNTYVGVTANLTVMVKQGNGDVWVDTMPLTKLETQVSARMAREVACELINVDCSKLDFYYKIRSSSSLIGGPSAGAMMTACTLSALTGVKINKSVVITGTINPDGSIGPVGLVDVKASVLPPNYLLLTPIGESVNDSVSVGNIIDAFKIMTGYDLNKPRVNVSSNYSSLMRVMASSLISKASSVVNGSYGELLLNQSQELFNDGYYYSSASYAVRSLINSFYYTGNINVSDIECGVNKLRSELMSKKLDNINDIEGLIITSDRISETVDLINKSLMSDGNESIFYASYAKARLITAYEWLNLIDYFNGTSDYSMNDLRSIVGERIMLARSSIAYAGTMINKSLLKSSINHLKSAVNAYDAGDYPYALFESLKARAEANMLITAFNDANTTNQLININNSALIAINNAMSNGYLPIMALSYYEYAGIFNDTYQKLLFLSYAREFASLGGIVSSNDFNWSEALFYFITSFIITFLLLRLKKVFK